MSLKFFSLTAVLLASQVCGNAANFGTIVPARGHLSDLAVDMQRNVVYAANFTANRVEVLSMASQSLLAPMNVDFQPSALALSPDNRYLVVGHYGGGNPSPTSGLTIVDLTTNSQLRLSLGTDSVLAVAFGNASSALVISETGVSLLDPASGKFTPLVLTDFASKPLPVPWATYPAGIVSGTIGVSGDGNVIYALVDQGGTWQLIRYVTGSNSPEIANWTSTPVLGPRSISVNKDGSSVMAGWVLFSLHNSNLVNIAQFPHPPGIINQGGHAFDWSQNFIYAQVVPGSIQTPSPYPNGTAGLLQTFDTDNLTVRETFQLAENLAGRALIGGTNMYAISDSGITIFPVGSLNTVHRIAPSKEDVLFQSNGCNQGVITQTFDIVDPGGNTTDFRLSSSSPGVTFSMNAGTTPATIKVTVEPSAFQDQKGTAAVTVTISSQLSVDAPATVRLLINTRDPDQQGAIYDVPGTVVDVVADPNRDRFYVLRQDRNQVLVFDGTSMSTIATLRTGNTPMQMAIFQDVLLVTNDNSQLVSVFDLANLVTLDPVYLPSGLYGRSVAVANGDSILATARSTSTACSTRTTASTPACLVTINIPNRIATAAPTQIYTNSVDVNSALTVSPSGQTMLMVMPDGTVSIYDANAHIFVASRSDVGAISGAYAALSDDLYLAGNTVLNTALVPTGHVDLLGGLAAGAIGVNNMGLITSSPQGGRNGVIQRVTLDNPDKFSAVSPIRTAEAPDLTSNTPPVPLGQIGQTILPFSRSLAPLSNTQSIVQLSTSGFTVIPWAFDTPKPQPSIAAVTNAADQSPAIAPGGLVTIWGAGMSSGNAAASSLPLTAGLNNVCVYANSIPVPLLFVSPTQINAQLPFGMPLGARLVLTNPNGSSAPFTLAAQAMAPAIFRTNDGTPLIVRSVDGKFIGNDTPIHLNEVLNIYLTGLGPVTPGVASGAGGPAGPLAATTTVPAVYIGGSQLFTLWSGLAPGFVGLYQVNVQVPFHNVPTGDSIPFTIVQGGAQTKVNLKVEQ